jgi:hypothetical protein
MTTVTVRLKDDGGTQSELRDRLGRLVCNLVQQGYAESPSIEPVYPGDEQGRWKRTFVVTFPDRGGKAFAENLNKQPDVELAYVAPARG